MQVEFHQSITTKTWLPTDSIVSRRVPCHRGKLLDASEYHFHQRRRGSPGHARVTSERTRFEAYRSYRNVVGEVLRA